MYTYCFFPQKIIINLKEERRTTRGRSEKPIQGEATRGTSALRKLDFIKIVGQMFGVVEENDRVTPLDSINPVFPTNLISTYLWLLKYAYPLKRYIVLKVQFSAILLLKIAQNGRKFKFQNARLDRHISNCFTFDILVVSSFRNHH